MSLLICPSSPYIRPNSPYSSAKHRSPFQSTPMGSCCTDIITTIALLLLPSDRYKFSQVCRRIRMTVLNPICWKAEIDKISRLAFGENPPVEKLPKNIFDAQRALVEKLSKFTYAQLSGIENAFPELLLSGTQNPLIKFMIVNLANAWKTCLKKDDSDFLLATDLSTYNFEALFIGLIRLNRITNLTVNCELSMPKVKCLALTLRAQRLKLNRFVLKGSEMTSEKIDILFHALSIQSSLEHVEIGNFEISAIDLTRLAFGLRNSRIKSLTFEYVTCPDIKQRFF